MTIKDPAGETADAIFAEQADEAADDNIMSEILGEPVGDADAKDDPKPVSGDGVEVKDEAPEDEAPEEEAADEPETDDEDEQPDDDDTETDDSYDAAVEVLKRDGWTAEDLRKLSKARVHALAESAATRQADANKTWQQLQELQKARETEAREKEAAIEPATETISAADVETLSAELSEDAVGTLQKWREADRAAVAELLKPLQEQVEAIQRAAFESQLTEARNRVGERFPGVADEVVFKSKVLPHLETLVATGKYQGKADEALEDAAKLAELERAPSKKPRSKRSKATSTTGTKQTRPETLSEDDVIDQAALASITGDTATLRKLGQL